MFVVVPTCSKRYKEFIKFGCTFDKDEKYSGAENMRSVSSKLYHVVSKSCNLLLLLLGWKATREQCVSSDTYNFVVIIIEEKAYHTYREPFFDR